MKDYCADINLQDNAIQESILLDDGAIVSIEKIGYEVIDVLTKEKLEQANSVVYCCDYDDNLWNFNLECVVSNKKINANVVINYGVDFAEQYTFDTPISIDDFNCSLKNLEEQDIRIVVLRNHGLEGMFDESSIDLSSSCIIMDGIQTSSLYVKKGEELLFYGVVGKNLSIAKGKLEDSFIKFLPQYMKDAILNPEKFLNDCKPSVPPPCCFDESIIEKDIEDEQVKGHNGND